MKRARVPGTYRGRIPDPLPCDLVCPSCEHAWTQDLIPAAHVFLNCPECGTKLEIGEKPPERAQFTRVTSRP